MGVTHDDTHEPTTLALVAYYYTVLQIPGRVSPKQLTSIDRQLPAMEQAGMAQRHMA